MSNKNIYLLKKIWQNLSRIRRRQVLLVKLLVVFTSLFDLLSIAISVPFFNLLIDSDWQKVEFFEYVRPLFVPNNSEEALLFVSMLFGIISIFASSLKLLTSYKTSKLTFGLGGEISAKVFNNVLRQDYQYHIETRSSELISGLTTKINVLIYGLFTPFLTLTNSIIQMLFLTGILFVVSFKITLIIFSSFGLIYYLLIRGFKRKISLNSDVIANTNTKVIGVIQEALGGIRNIIINSLQDLYVKDYSRNETKLREAQSMNFFIGQSPRFVVDSLAITILVGLIFGLIVYDYSISDFLPTIVVIFYGIQRLVPLAQQIYNSVVTMRGDITSVGEVLEFLNLDIPKTIETSKKVCFESIVFKNVSFNYATNENYVLNRLDITINRGGVIGIVGESGSGKSTWLDLLLGLNKPSEGEILLNNRRLDIEMTSLWRNSLTHVSQNEFLRDTDFLDNITFGKGVDIELFNKVLRISCLYDFIYSLPKSYRTLIGEGGAQISGGQRQRIAIARALYKESEVIILDEATSALDEETEEKILDGLTNYSENTTIILVTHRKSTLSRCSDIFEIRNGKFNKINIS